METAPVYVAGLGLLSAIGRNVAESLTALETSQAGLGAMTYLDSVHRGHLPVGEVKQSNAELARASGMSPRVNRTALLSALAAREALDDAGLDGLEGLRTGFVSANTVGGMDRSEVFFREFLPDPRKGRLRDVIHHECGMITEVVADHLGLREYVTTISTACSSSANALFFGARLIKAGLLDVVLAGGADSLTKFTLNGFNTLMILDPQDCQPFDENRRGLNLGEGAGYLVLVSEGVAALLKKAPYARLSGYANANDAFHQTASSPDGTGSYLAMQGALARSGLQPADIDYINAHGTGTQNNDIAEGTAIRRLFEPTFPKISSTKSFTGHTLGACGGIEAVLSVLSVRDGLIYPNLRFETAMKELSFVPETRFQRGQPIRHVLSNSFGFGGNCSSLIFSKN